MRHPETQRLIDLVEQQTAYRVAIDVISGIQEHAQMSSASPGAPTHVIRVNAERRQFADYIVAMQCGMLLILWSDHTRVPGMAFETARCDDQARKWAQTEPTASLAPDIADRMSKFYVDGLLRQLSSMPLEIRVARFLFEACPNLREAQTELTNAHLRQLSVVFAPRIRDQVPVDVFKLNVGMNAALALNWARLSGNRVALLPYESTGYLTAAQTLLDLLEPGSSVPTSADHIRSVDAWADHLSLRSLYRWEFSNRRHES